MKLFVLWRAFHAFPHSVEVIVWDIVWRMKASQSFDFSPSKNMSLDRGGVIHCSCRLATQHLSILRPFSWQTPRRILRRRSTTMHSQALSITDELGNRGSIQNTFSWLRLRVSTAFPFSSEKDKAWNTCRLKGFWPPVSLPFCYFWTLGIEPFARWPTDRERAERERCWFGVLDM